MSHLNNAQSSMLLLAFSAALIALTVSYTVDAETLADNASSSSQVVALASSVPTFEPPTLAPSAIVLNAAPSYRMEEGLVKLYFGPGKTEIAPAADRALQDIAQNLRQGARVQISGFHDHTGNPKQNILLSQKRAHNVQQRLIALGAPANAIEMKKPAVAMTTQDHFEARRVEVALVAKPTETAAKTAKASDSDTPLYRLENGLVKLYFAPSKTDIPSAVDSALAAIVQAAQSGKQVLVAGFHDETGNPKQNIVISQKRAQTVQKRLIALGVPASAIAIKQPEVAAGEDYAEARRVEVSLL